MARCGCSGTCACVLTTDNSLSLSGNGSGQSPWLLRVVPNCDATMECLNGRTDEPLDVTNGRLGVKVSEDDDQVLTTGSDGGLYVPGCAAGAVAIGDTSTVDLSGAGQVGNPLTATWLGNTVTNTPDTGVRIEGNGTPAAPLHANWGGINMAVVNPEITASGNGTPTSPLTLAWSGLPWSKFQAQNLDIVTGATSIPIPNWTLYGGHGGSLMVVGGSVAGQPNALFTCQRSGSYIVLFRLRFLLTPAAPTVGGYMQVNYNRVDVAGSTFDAIVNSYNAGWIDLNYVEQVSMVAGRTYDYTLFNNTGAHGTGGYAWTTFFRISD